jgi:hypothetical protein
MPGSARLAGNFVNLSKSLIVTGVAFGAVHVAALANERPVKVEGYFCDAKADQLAFLNKKVEGENEVMASNAVNKAVGKASCMPYIVADAVAVSEQTVMHNGYVFVLRSYKFLPEDVERWHGTVAGSLQQNAQKHDI